MCQVLGIYIGSVYTGLEGFRWVWGVDMILRDLWRYGRGQEREIAGSFAALRMTIQKAKVGWTLFMGCVEEGKNGRMRGSFGCASE